MNEGTYSQLLGVSRLQVLKALKRVVFVLYLLFMAGFVLYHIYYANRVIPGVVIAGIDVGGKKTEEVVGVLQAKLVPSEKVLVRVGDDYETVVYPSDVRFRYLPVETTRTAFAVGRGGFIIGSLRDKITGIVSKIEVSPIFDYDKSEMESLVNRVKIEAGRELREPSFAYDEGILKITAGTTGLSFDDDSFKERLVSQFIATNVKVPQMYIKLYEIDPSLTVQDLDLVKAEMQQIMETPFNLIFRDKTWPLTSEEILLLVRPARVLDEVTLTVHQLSLVSKLNEIALELNQNPSGQVLEVEGRKAVKFVASQDGLKLKMKESAEVISRALLVKKPNIELAVQVTKAPAGENEFGVEQLLGVGKSKFKGSSAGRIHNIVLASSRVSGTLVPPGEVFSFNEAVGEISKKTGYTSAWIISKGRTILGDGGGVCQVSTTVFRAGLNAGLPVVERNAHSYRVSYYEQDSPAGIDATIYRPSVDLKFRNDTPGYILITAEVDKENYSLVFKIYGKDDGRTVEMTEPKVLSKTPPPAPVYIEDPNLSKGVTRQVEYPVWGASVTFDRIVRRDGKVLYKDTFKSNYRAWGAVYHVGTKD